MRREPLTLVQTILTSPRNPLIKDVRQAVRSGGLTEAGFSVAEGHHLLAEAKRSGCRIDIVLAAESVAGRVQADHLVVLSESLFQSIAGTESSQGVIALVQPPVWTPQDVFAASGPVIVVDGIQDPGNAGAILRVAEAFEASGAVWLKGSANPYHPKALRASAGSCFRVPLLVGVSVSSALSMVGSDNRPLFAAMPHGADSLDYAPLSQRCAIAIGAEGRGVGAELAHAATAIRIPTRSVESLNAAVAAGILLYEAWRQRRHSL